MGGIPYEELGRSSLRKTQLLYLAEQQRVELAAKVHIDLKMTEVSGRELARNKRLQDEGDPKDKRSDEEKAQDKADAERGPEMLKDYRLSLAFQSWAPQHKAAHVRRYGWPGQEAAERAKPYAGMTSEVAREMLELLDLGKLDERFSGFWEQVPDDVTDRLKASLKE